MSRKILMWFYIALFVGVCFLLVATLSSKPEEILINNEKITQFNNNWQYSLNGNEVDTISLPYFVKSEKYDRINIRHTLPETYTPGMTICFRTSQQYVRVTVDDKEVYSYGYNVDQKFGESPGSIWNFVRLTNDTASSIIDIELISPYKSSKNIINKINYGSKNSNVFYIMENYALGLFISLLIIIVGILQLLFYIFLGRQLKNKALLYLGLFSISAGIWSLTETKMVQFFFKNQTVTILFSFVFLLLLAIPMLLFVAETHGLHNKKPIYALAIILLINFFVSLTLQIFNVLDFIESSISVHILLVISMLYLIFAILVDVIKHRNKEAYVLGVGTGFLAFISFFDIINFYNLIIVDSSFFFRLGVLSYIIILSYNTIRQIVNIIQQNLRIDVLEQLAYIDLLTDLQNRTSFEKQMNIYREDIGASENVIIGIFDVNNLKTVNDNFGHKYGDDLIINAAHCIKHTFESVAVVYRIGGDEFAIIMNSSSSNDINSLFTSFEANVKKSHSKNDIKLSVACGFAIYDPNIDRNIDSVYIRADKEMYDKKAIMKSNTISK